ncbi:MAG: hypothetical protein PHG86_06300, partial [Candidatus Methanomethylophilaceae archaeon]|nr:hypothetical protein [Candidatus Methanomethylophilaceae archaeon]
WSVMSSDLEAGISFLKCSSCSKIFSGVLNEEDDLRFVASKQGWTVGRQCFCPSCSKLKEVSSISEIDISQYNLNFHERSAIRAYLETGKRYLMEICDPKEKEEAERLQRYRDLIALSNGKRGVKKPHENHDVFTLSDVIDYYSDKDHIIKDEVRKVFESHISGHRLSDFYVVTDLIIDKVSKYPEYSNYSKKRVELEVTRACQRLSVRRIASLFPGTPRFKKDSISIDIPGLVKAIKDMTKPKEIEIKEQPEKGLLHDVRLSADRPPFYSEDIPDEKLEQLVDGDLQERDRALENIEHCYDELHPISCIEELTTEQRFIIEHAQAHENCVNLQWLLDIAIKSPMGKQYNKKNLYQRLYRASKNLEKKGIISMVKGAKSPIFTGINQKNKAVAWTDGLIWVVLDQSKIHDIIAGSATKLRLGDTEKSYLIKGYCKIPTDEITPIQPKKAKRDPYAIPNRCGSLRKAAINFEMGVNTFDLEENTLDRELKRHSQGPYHDIKTIMNFFKIYQDESMRKIITLLNTITGEVIGFDYSTRFNDYAKGIERLKRYEYAHDLSLEQFKEATFVTLTTDPKKFPNLWRSNRHASTAWNTFMQILTVKLGKRKDRVKYMAAFEYTKTGLLHIHTLIFGRRYLNSPDQKEERKWISQIWNDSCGQGKIVDSYGLKNNTREDGHKEWQWYSTKDHPHDAGQMSGGNYLKKYLKKCMMAIMDRYEDSSSTLAPYWTEGHRFYSCSQSFNPPKGVDMTVTAADISIFEFNSIGYGMNVSDAMKMGIIDRVAYTRFDPDNVVSADSGGDDT